MHTQTVTHGSVAPGETFSEVGMINHDGRAFSAGGAIVTDDYLVGYWHGADDSSPFVVAAWNGEPLGRGRVTASWRTPRSYVSSRMYQVLVTLRDGRQYTGRSAGAQMIIKAKRTNRT